ncbi:MAG TPA: 3-hydroxyacyl-ACP dehydratase FabZ [Aquihabitans sp.]|jgi:3-hydroxyacyl-[acyl-carrier-protein] dehydratase|nr:3-hydroxyacyl-ACP dehydratase FabZ [Aquihabitans sp.]
MADPTPPPPTADDPAAAPLDAAVALLPHGPPFRFVDRVERCEPGVAVTARWRIGGDEPWLAGHFPGNPIVPGVLQLEALAQAGAIAVLAHPDHAGRLPLFGGVEEVRFRRPVAPGEELLLEVEIERLGGRGGWGRGRASVDGAETCRGRLLFVITDLPAGAAT